MKKTNPNTSGTDRTERPLRREGNRWQNAKSTYWIGEDFLQMTFPMRGCPQHSKNSYSATSKSQTIRSKRGGGQEQTFLQRRHADGQQTREKMLSNHNHRRRINRTAMRCHLPIWSQLLSERKSECWWGRGGKGSLGLCCGNPDWCTLWKPVSRALKRLKIELSHDPAIPSLGIYAKETPLSWNDMSTSMSTAALFTAATHVPIKRWIKPLWGRLAQ